MHSLKINVNNKNYNNFIDKIKNIPSVEIVEHYQERNRDEVLEGIKEAVEEINSVKDGKRDVGEEFLTFLKRLENES